MRILVVSPIASHPQNQGNSARIMAICKQMQAAGHIVHFLYYQLEGLTPAQAKDMAECWDHFHPLPVGLASMSKTLGDFYALDDWYDPNLGDFAAQLNERWRFDVVWVNYVWISGVLDALPDNLIKVIDTHDIFGDRHLRFLEIGLQPEWYFTTREQERIGLNRANIVVAIQNQEHSELVELLAGDDVEVVTIGHALPPRFFEPQRVSDKLTVGYLGSGNPFNVTSLKIFAENIQAHPELLRHFKFKLAGSICDRLPELPPFEVVGRVDELEEFYTNVDLVINPMQGGTGLKIKTLEALSYGNMFAGTPSALVGITGAAGEFAQDIPENALALIPLMFGQQVEVFSSQKSKATFLQYSSAQASALKNLLERANSHE